MMTLISSADCLHSPIIVEQFVRYGRGNFLYEFQG